MSWVSVPFKKEHCVCCSNWPRFICIVSIFLAGVDVVKLLIDVSDTVWKIVAYLSFNSLKFTVSFLVSTAKSELLLGPVEWFPFIWNSQTVWNLRVFSAVLANFQTGSEWISAAYRRKYFCAQFKYKQAGSILSQSGEEENIHFRSNSVVFLFKQITKTLILDF